MQLQINKITITGFRGYKDTVEYNLGYRTSIKGGNALGKSTIREAICWALTGCDSTGNEKATTKLVNDQKPKYTEVILDFMLDDEPQTIIRRKKGSSTDIYLNDKKVSTADIAREIYENKNVFLSILNPYYFPDLTPKDAKALLSDVLKPVSREEIFKELGDYFKKLLLDNGFRMPETFLQDVRAELKEQQENIIYLEGVQEGSKPMEILEKKVFDDEALNALKEELAGLKAPSEYDADIQSLVMQGKALESDFNSIVYQDPKDTSMLKRQREIYLKDYKANRKNIDSLEHHYIKCPNCGGEVDTTEERRNYLLTNEKELIEKGKGVAAEIKSIEEENKKIEERNIKIREQKKLEFDEKLKVISEKMDALKAAKAKANESYESQTAELKAKISTLEAEKNEVIRFNAEIDAATQHNEKLVKEQEANKVAIQNSKNKVEQLKLAIDAGKQYNSIKLKKQAEQIGKYLDKVTIQFEKLTKDGELKDKFEVLYENKEFNKLSNSEKIKAGLEISNLLINLQNMHIPVFVDDAESINDVPMIDTQMIIARVTKDPEVSVEVIENDK